MVMEYKDLRVTEWRQAQPIKAMGKILFIEAHEEKTYV